MSTDEIVRNYQRFLENSWQTFRVLESLDSKWESLLSDWLQANWEIMVEALVCPDPDQFLEVYADGADCNDASSRVWMPTALPNHRIFCIPRQGNRVKDVVSGQSIDVERLVFNRFISWDGKQYETCPPFNFVLLENDTDQFIVHSKDVIFQVTTILST